ncbi:hypothetical protein ZWY2020_008911 [Hordeum vulgare]|nr:hypothetical protein ZWY2020_008911 [Hordeum vulgare]
MSDRCLYPTSKIDVGAAADGVAVGSGCCSSTATAGNCCYSSPAAMGTTAGAGDSSVGVGRSGPRDSLAWFIGPRHATGLDGDIAKGHGLEALQVGARGLHQNHVNLSRSARILLDK